MLTELIHGVDMAAPKNHKGIAIMLYMSTELNEKLSASAKNSGRSKVTEALFRLEDHLNLFESIATPGQRFPAGTVSKD